MKQFYHRKWPFLATASCSGTIHGGGVALYVHDSLCCKEPVFQLGWASAVGCFLSFSHATLVPHLKQEIIIINSCVEVLLTSLDGSCMSTIIMGDFNIDQLRLQESLAIDLVGVMSSVGLTQVVTEAMRVTPSSSSVIA